MHGMFVAQKLRGLNEPHGTGCYENLHYNEFTPAPNVVKGPDWLQTFTPL
jgi:hypothetical protein